MTGAEQPRASEVIYDLAGRLVSSGYGEGRAALPSRPVRALSGSPILRELQKIENDYGSANTELPGTSTATEDLVHRQRWSLAFDTLGQTTHAGIDGTDVSFDHRFDESGNVTSSKTPAQRGTTTYDYDARSFNTAEHLPATPTSTTSDPKNKYEPDANGVLKQYTDPTGEPTKVTNDGIGRAVHREYADRTFEDIHYVGARVDSTRDRQGREQHFDYDEGGRLFRVLNASGVELDRITYENGRVKSWKTPDALIEFSDFDLDNHPQQITQHRFDGNGIEIDVYTIGHQWTAAGELRRTDMPSYQGMSAGARWASRIEYTHDAAGNVDTILRNSAPLMNAQFRSAGRPKSRNVTLANGSILSRAYDYDDANGTGRMSGMHVSVGNALLAGSALTFEGFQRKSEQLLGISGGTRFTTWDYDDRGRVDGSVVATVDPNAVPLLGIPGATKVRLTDADFRNAIDRSVIRPSDKPSTITAEGTQGGHKVATITRGANSDSILYKGSNGEEVSVRTDDARYHYDFDEKEHLRSITERLIANGTQSRLIRVRYAYDGFGRIVGRRVETAPVSNNQPPLDNAWTLATPDVVANQPLPVATTFVWDPVTDNLAAIFIEGSSRNGSTLPNGGLLRQFIHGGMGMDDPIEVVTADARLFPIFDESGAGSLQAILDENGHLLARNLPADVYGEEEVAIAAPAIDGVKLTATKDTNGNVTQVAVTMHATEPLDASTIATGVRLAAVASNGTVVRTSTATPAQPNPYTITWTMSASEWSALTATNGGNTTPTAISIAATSSLRSTTYGIDIPILPATPDMQSTGTVFSTAALPFEVREPINTITQQFTTSTTDTPFTLPNLTALGTDSSAIANGLILSPFQALPFVEPMTGLTNARARWYEPGTGSWLSPDPLGYQDSSNLYAFAGGDPVNGRDPEGLGLWDDIKGELAEKAGNAVAVAELGVGLGKALFRPDLVVKEKVKETVDRIKRVAKAYKQGGAAGAGNQYVAEEKAYLKTLPFVRTVVAAQAIPAAAKQGRFQKGLQTGRAALSLAGDIALVAAPFLGGEAAGAETGEIAAFSPATEVPELEIVYYEHGDPIEFARQAAGQEAGFRRLTASEVKTAIEDFRENGRPPEADRAIAAFRRENPDVVKNKAVVHNPDPCVGGPCGVDGVGGVRENSSLGAQNRWRQQQVYDYVSSLPPSTPLRVRVRVLPREP
ncbi:MAG: hypothetical protein QOK37_1897 [Thermoanaerobaculia bacterium]|jgi:RHS repeat-associated protein|nr:hypothetical protein [Thermoanaerobaculia bacterium]